MNGWTMGGILAIAAGLSFFAFQHDATCVRGKDPAFKLANSLCLAGCC